MAETIFDKIVAGEMDAYVVWEDDEYMAFLTPFPNTPGHTVIIKKENPGDYIYRVNDESMDGIMRACRTVSKKLEKAFDTNWVGTMFHGLGVPHLHAQMVPYHANLDLDPAKAEEYRKNHPELARELSPEDGPKMDDAELEKYQRMIKEAQ